MPAPTLPSTYLPNHQGVGYAVISPYIERLQQYGREVKSPAWLQVKNHCIAMVGEYVGTSLFMVFALGGTNVANTASMSEGGTIAHDPSNLLLYIALCFGFSLTVNVWIFFRVSGGLFNPAVSLGMALVGAITPIRAILLVVSQLLGGISGAALVGALFPHGTNTGTSLAPGVSVARGVFIEMVLTSLLMLAILFLAAEQHRATFLAPIGIGLALFVAELLGVPYTGGALNPVRALGPAVVRRSFPPHHWVYWVGPTLGATLAAVFYIFLKFLEYETVLGPEDRYDVEPPHVGHDPMSAPADPGVPDITLLNSVRHSPAPAQVSRPFSRDGSESVKSDGLLERLDLPHLSQLRPSTSKAAEPGLPLAAPSQAQDDRLERMERMLSWLITWRGQAGGCIDEETGSVST